MPHAGDGSAKPDGYCRLEMLGRRRLAAGGRQSALESLPRRLDCGMQMAASHCYFGDHKLVTERRAVF
jgi:hypothetical protein